ncbi:MAG: zinc ribbon domain-containing protein [Proteobacteria bacterium]|nr:zinc ribbon domain-containing protein [Pseudomonadota bacterium]
MPTYEYECSKGCRFEFQQSIMDDALERCNKQVCPRERSGVKVTRLISAANFILKGSGWYADGYSGNGGSNGGDQDSKAAESSKSSDSKGKDKGSGSSSSKSGESSAPASAGSSAS